MAEEVIDQPVELTDDELKAEKQKIVDGVNNPTPDDIEPELPSEGKKFANVYETVEDLKKGIQNLKADVPDYMLNGMNDEALEQYYTDLRKEFSSKPKEEAPEPEAKIEEPEAKATVGDDALWQELDAEFTAKGGLSDEYYDKLNKLGIPSPVVDKYLDGLKAESQQFTNNIYELAGGEEQYTTIKAWAEENYTQAQLDMIASGSKEEILFKMKGVKAEYDSKVASGDVPDRVFGTNATKANGYANQSEYLLDVMSPEYKRNPKYKAKVQAKLQASSFSS